MPRDGCCAYVGLQRTADKSRLNIVNICICQRLVFSREFFKDCRNTLSGKGMRCKNQREFETFAEVSVLGFRNVTPVEPPGSDNIARTGRPGRAASRI